MYEIVLFHFVSVFDSDSSSNNVYGKHKIRLVQFGSDIAFPVFTLSDSVHNAHLSHRQFAINPNAFSSICPQKIALTRALLAAPSKCTGKPHQQISFTFLFLTIILSPLRQSRFTVFYIITDKVTLSRNLCLVQRNFWFESLNLILDKSKIRLWWFVTVVVSAQIGDFRVFMICGLSLEMVQFLTQPLGNDNSFLPFTQTNIKRW